MRLNTATLALLSLACLLAPASLRGGPDDAGLALELAQGLIAACPLADPGDEAAREQSASRLAQFTRLRDACAETVFWGGHTRGQGYGPQDSNVTLFNPLVWRKLYLSLFMFSGAYRIEVWEPYTLLHLPCRFRNALDMGAYPYPFWHSQAKWTSYQRATEVLFVLSKGRVLGGYRSDEQDLSRPFVPRTWDGRWRWQDSAGREMPFVSLYHWLFSPSNPYVDELDARYRAFEAAARPQTCITCHSPNNSDGMRALTLLTFPNQALNSRHRLVSVLEGNLMPPRDIGVSPGIGDEGKRQTLVALAKSFAEAGDHALAYEQERQPGPAVDLNDATLALQSLIGLVTLSPTQESAFDLDKNGRVDIQDVARLLREAVGL